MNRFYEIMQKHPDAKLLGIVEKKRAGYEPEAVAAAEQVLTERGVSWNAPPQETETATELSVKEVRHEIQRRLERGENIEQVKMRLKDKGVSAFEFAEKDQEETEKKAPAFAFRRKRLRVIIATWVACTLIALKLSSESKDPTLLALVIGAGLAVSIIALLWQKPKQ